MKNSEERIVLMQIRVLDSSRNEAECESESIKNNTFSCFCFLNFSHKRCFEFIELYHFLQLIKHVRPYLNRFVFEVDAANIYYTFSDLKDSKPKPEESEQI